MGSVPNFSRLKNKNFKRFCRKNRGIFVRQKKAFKQEQRSKAGRMAFVAGFVCSGVGGGWKYGKCP